MGTAPNCNFIGATLCPGSTGPSPLWVNKAMLPRNFLGTGGSFTYDGACYSVPANAQPQPPSGGSYAGAGYMGGTSSGCANCCSIKPETVYFDCSGTGTATINVSGPPNSTVYLSWSSCYLVVNGVGPTSGGNSTTIALGSSGGTFTVGTSSNVCAIPCPGGPTGISVGTTQGGSECGMVEIYTGCQPCPTTPTSITAHITVSPLNCTGGVMWGGSGDATLTCNNPDGNWGGYVNLEGTISGVIISCFIGDGSYGTVSGNLYWRVEVSSAPELCGGPGVCNDGGYDVDGVSGYFVYNGQPPDTDGNLYALGCTVSASISITGSG